ncbi:MAG: Ig-like domain repeat protein, partial [Acidobacteriaceae bacterium]
VAQMRDAFAVQVHRYEVNGNPHYATATEPQIPAALAPVVAGFVSLNNFRLKSHARLMGRAQYDPKTGKATPTWTVPGGAGYPTIGGVNFALSPADFATQYDLNPLYTAGVNGTGETIAIINESNINITLVNAFRSLFNLPANPPNVIIDGNDPGVDGINDPDGPNYASPEAYLDVEWSGAVAPDATIDLVIAADTALESGLFLAAEHAVDANIAPVMSMSFGECEVGLGSTNAFIDQVLMEQAAAQGITVMVSTGDDGSAGCDDEDSQYYAVSGLAVSGFASTPWNVAVGGTDFYYGSNYATLTLAGLGTYWNTTGTNTPSGSLLSYIPEQPWNSSQFGLDASNYYTTYGVTSIAGGSGGASSAAVCSTGYSTTTGACSGTLSGYPKPSWQTGTGVPADKVRDIPDVSLFAADGSNYTYYPICYEDGDCQPNSSGPVQIFGVGGTSASAPSFAGIMALVNQKWGRQGQADFVLYPMKTQFPAAFHDITAGTNAVPCSLSTVTDSSTGQSFPPTNCISAGSNAVTITDPTFGSATEGEIGTGSTPDYNAAAGYNLATGLGSVDANVLVNDWGSVENSFGTATVTLTPSTTTPTVGQTVTISGSVTGTATPTGSVALISNSTSPLTAALATFPLTASGTFSGTVNDLPGGTYQIWGQYSGNVKNGPSTSAPVSITVAKIASVTTMGLLNSTGSTSVTSGSTAVPYGTQMEVNAYVSGASNSGGCVNAAGSRAFTCPTGAITFSDGSSAINTAILNAEGDAEYNAPFAVGSHSVTATYAGDSSYNASSAAAVTFTVVQNTPTVFIGASNYEGTASSGAFVLAGGQNTYFNILIENSANLNSSGATATGYPMPVPIAAPTGTVTVTGLPGGTQTINLTAGVDPDTGQAAGLAVVNIANPSSSDLDLSHQPNPWLPGGGAAVFACVVLLAIPARRRAWRNFLCFVVFAGLVAAGISCGGGGGSGGGNVGPIGGGGGSSSGTSYTLGISYSGDGNYVALTGSTAQSGTITIAAPTLATTTISATSSGSISPTTSMAVTGTITGQSGDPAPTGVIYVIPNGLGVTNEFGLTPGSGDSSTFTGAINSQTLDQGANFVTLQYSGDKNYNGSATILNSGSSIGNPLSDFSVTAVPSLTVSGGTGTTTLFVNPANGFTGSVGLTCSPNCSLSASSVTLPATGSSTSAQVTLTVTGLTTAGTYPITVTGTAGSQIHTFGVSAVVQ